MCKILPTINSGNHILIWLVSIVQTDNRTDQDPILSPKQHSRSYDLPTQFYRQFYRAKVFATPHVKSSFQLAGQLISTAWPTHPLARNLRNKQGCRRGLLTLVFVAHYIHRLRTACDQLSYTIFELEQKGQPVQKGV